MGMKVHNQRHENKDDYGMYTNDDDDSTDMDMFGAAGHKVNVIKSMLNEREFFLNQSVSFKLTNSFLAF